MRKILLVEDSETIIMGLKYSLEQEDFEVVVAKNVKDALKESNEKFDLIILDVSLPDGNGFELCKSLKSINDTPVIFLTACDEEENVIKGLDIGADDYIVKPFRIRELISRINTILRRIEKKDKSDNFIKIKDITIDVDSARVLKGEKEVVLTSLEYKILLMLFSNPNKLITREQILDRVWDVAGNFVNDNTLTVYIKRIREKIEDNNSNSEIIKTVRGMGYKVGE